MIPQETVDLILDTARIEDVVSDFVTLRRRGASYVACCPFHNEKTPSFYVTPSKNIYKCFGCGKAGSAVGFVMEYEHLSYVDALKYLARKYHIEIVEEEQSAEEIALKQRRESLMLVSEFAAGFYADQLKQGEGLAVGYSYFRSRSITDETISKFGLGWAPEARTALIDAAVAAGYKMEYLLAAGLAVQREDGTIVDKFRGRAMFPIHTVSGRVIAFSGRTLHADVAAKYLNSPDTEIYTKSKILLGIYFAKSEISRLGKCIVVEGNVDMVMMHQLGLRNVVAPCGTALTEEQIQLIHRFTEDLTIMFDGDGAGIRAALGKIDMVLSEGLNVRIVLLPDGEDPDSFCRAHTLDEVNEYISSHEQDFVSFKTDMLLGDAAGDPIRKANLINDIADTIAVIPDAVKRSVYVEMVSAKFNVDAGILFTRIADKRQRMLAERQVAEDRMKRRMAAELPPLPEEGFPAAPEEMVAAEAPEREEENPVVGPAEKELLYFLLTHGDDVLEFESDSEFYSGDESSKPTVAQFIYASIFPDGGHLINSSYDKVYQEYMKQSLEGVPQERILKSLLNSPDPAIEHISAQLSVEKYQLTVKNFESALTTTSSWLVTFVPKAILVYMDKKLESAIFALGNRMKDASADPDALGSLMQEMVKLQGVQRKLRMRMNRK